MVWAAALLTALTITAIEQSAPTVSLSCSYSDDDAHQFDLTIFEDRQQVTVLFPGIDPVTLPARIGATEVIWADASKDIVWASSLSRVDLTLKTLVRQARKPDRYISGACTIPNRQF
jgi:hypothetical protein